MKTSPFSLLLPIVLLSLGACDPASNASVDAVDGRDVALGLDTANDDVDPNPDGAGQADVADGVELDLGPAAPPETQPLSLDWAVQSEQSPGMGVGFPFTLGLSDGSVVAVAQFNGTVTFGGRSVTATDENYVHALFVRVSPAGEVVALSRLCDRCVGFGGVSLAELPGGDVAVASVANGAVVLSPGAAAEARVDADKDVFVGVIAPDGALRRWALVAHLPGAGDVGALAVTPDGGLVIGGNAMGLEVAGGPSFVAEEGWHYPGRAFLVGLDAALAPRFAEQLGGAAGSTINLLYVEKDGDGDAIVAVGDFGGYPLGVTSVFGAGTPDALTLASVSSDDDPAMDIFLARWTFPTGPGVGRPAVDWARRVAHYSNGPRNPTWIRATANPGELELRIDGTESLEPDGEGELQAPPYSNTGSLVVRLSRDGEVTPRFSSLAPVLPSSDGFIALSSAWAGSKLELGDESAPSFPVPEATHGPDGVNWYGYALSQWRADGALEAAGLLLQSVSQSFYPLSLQRVVAQADGSALVLFHGSAPVTFVPSEGEPVPLDREPGYERLVVVRARLR